MIRWRPKDPDDVVNRGVTFADHFHPDEILVSATWTMPVGLTLLGQSQSGQQAAIRLSGGVAGSKYVVGVRGVSNMGQQIDETAEIQVVER